MREELEELVDAVLAMGRAFDSVSQAAAQERLVEACWHGKLALRPPVLKVKGPGGRIPTRAHDNDAGLDLYVDQPTRIPPGQFVDVDLGIAVEFPTGWWGRLVGRSSTIRNRRLLVAEGTIDEGYRGPLYAGVWNLSQEEVACLQPGDRIAQLILLRTPPPLEIQSVAELAESSRGVKGFGSTGA